MNVLVIAPHPDDESIGCGGTICVHAGQGDRVAAVFLTSGESGLPDQPAENAGRVRECEAERAAAILGLSAMDFLRRPDRGLEADCEGAARALKPILEREKPELVYLTHERDFHPDHRAAVPILRFALSLASIRRPALLSYEVLTPLTECDRAEDIGAVMRRKLEAVRAHRSQVRQFRYDAAVRSLNRYRGIVAQVGEYAEAFRFADHAADRIPAARRADPSWHRVYSAAEQIAALIPPEDAFILVDEARLEASVLMSPRRCIPFLERDGRYWGEPLDNEAAIRELERLRAGGASFMVFAWPAFWWLDSYAGLNRYLRAKFSCIRQDRQMIVFDLRREQDSGQANA